jgi:hypothetical protein
MSAVHLVFFAPNGDQRPADCPLANVFNFEVVYAFKKDSP